MSFNKIFLFIFSLLMFGCGVKSPPLKHPDTVLESYVRKYTHEPEPEVNKEQDEGKPPAKAPQN